MVENNERFNWAVELMKVKPSHKILEIGCGVGFAVEIIAAQLKSGHITAIDKSKPMIDKAVRRNQKFIESKVATFQTTELLKFSNEQRFDNIFCFNINIFWTKKSVTKEVDVIKKHLSEKGLLHIFYGPMFGAGYKKILNPVKDNLEKENLKIIESIYEKKIECCCFIAKPRDRKTE
jgi:protein-L-isoaspartate O-methyltransferase